MIQVRKKNEMKGERLMETLKSHLLQYVTHSVWAMHPAKLQAVTDVLLKKYNQFDEVSKVGWIPGH